MGVIREYQIRLWELMNWGFTVFKKAHDEGWTVLDGEEVTPTCLSLLKLQNDTNAFCATFAIDLYCENKARELKEGECK